MVINIEERRKDYWQMLTHHIVTTMLIFTSYGYHQTKVANLILCIMDVVDIFLSVNFPFPPLISSLIFILGRKMPKIPRLRSNL